jgi:hypothetical protein
MLATFYNTFCPLHAILNPAATVCKQASGPKIVLICAELYVLRKYGEHLVDNDNGGTVVMYYSHIIFIAESQPSFHFLINPEQEYQKNASVGFIVEHFAINYQQYLIKR